LGGGSLELPASTHRGVIVAAASALLVIDVFWPAAAWSQNAPWPSGDPRFQAVLARPFDLGTSLRYAAGSEQVGDLEASIGALERLLFYNPNLTRVRFELGVLYFRLGSYEMARGYFQIVLASAEAGADIKQRAQDFVDAIETALKVDRWSGFAQTGIGYQTNASAGPSQQALLSSNLTVDSRLLGLLALPTFTTSAAKAGTSSRPTSSASTPSNSRFMNSTSAGSTCAPDHALGSCKTS
jgi:tetratricopeptide (TPR) repeat protein